MALGLYFLCVIGFVGYIWTSGHSRSADAGWIAYWCLVTLALVWAPRFPLVGIACYILLAYGMSSHAPELDIMLSMRILDGVSLFALLAWCLSRSRPSASGLLKRPVMRIGLLLAGWIALCLAAALLRGVPWGQFLRHDPSTFGQAAVVCLIAAHVLRIARDSLLLVCCVVGTVLGRAALQGISGLYLESYVATLLVIGVPIAVLGVYTTEARTAKALLAAVALAMSGLLLVTQNRAAAVAACGMGGMLLWQTRTRSWGRLLGIVAALASVLAVALPTAYLDRFRALWDSGSAHATASLDRGTAQERIELWAAGWEMAANQPLFGVGPGNYPVFLKIYRPDMETLAAHNSIVQMMAETGFVGGLLYLAFFVGAVFMLGRTGCQGGIGWRAPAARMLQLALVGYLVGGVFNSRHDFVLAYVLVGWAVAICSYPEPAGPHLWRRPASTRSFRP